MSEGIWKVLTLVSVVVFLCVAPVSGEADPALPVVSVLNVHDGARVKGPDLVLRLRVSPPPSPRHPDHFHLFVNGRMVTMFTMVRASRTIQLHHLPKGRDRVAILSADPKTHHLMGESNGGQMSGTDTGEMGAMNMSEMRAPPRKIALGTRFVLFVR